MRHACLPLHSRVMLHQPSGGAQGQASDIAIMAKASCAVVPCLACGCCLFGSGQASCVCRGQGKLRSCAMIRLRPLCWVPARPSRVWLRTMAESSASWRHAVSRDYYFCPSHAPHVASVAAPRLQRACFLLTQPPLK